MFDCGAVRSAVGRSFESLRKAAGGGSRDCWVLLSIWRTRARATPCGGVRADAVDESLLPMLVRHLGGHCRRPSQADSVAVCGTWAWGLGAGSDSSAIPSTGVWVDGACSISRHCVRPWIYWIDDMCTTSQKQVPVQMQIQPQTPRPPLSR